MSERANLRAQRAKIRPETADLRLQWPKGGGRKDRKMEGQTSRNSPLCPTGHRPFGAAAQKSLLQRIFLTILLDPFKTRSTVLIESS